VFVELGEQFLGQHPALVVDHGGGRLVAARFNAQNDHKGVIPLIPAEVAFARPARLERRQVFEEKRARRKLWRFPN
jgi:hypothetical protein